MKKEYIACYLGLAFFLGTFIAAVLLNRADHERQGEIAADACLIEFGITVLIGLYSNVKNYGFFYTRVSDQDVNLRIAQLDQKYPRIKKGTKGYVVGIVITAILFGIAPAVFGVVRLVRVLTIHPS